MAVCCPQCRTPIDQHDRAATVCPVCGSRLPTNPRPAVQVDHGQATGGAPVATSAPAPDTPVRPVAEARRGPMVTNAGEGPMSASARQASPLEPARRREVQATTPMQPGTQRPVAAPAATGGRASTLEGVVVRVDPLQAEPADFNLPRLLFSLLLVADLILILGSLALVVLVLLALVLAAALLLRATWLVTILVQSVFFFLSPLVGTLTNRRSDDNRVPVANYLIRTSGGRVFTCRVKGQLQGASVALQDRIRVWGHPQNGILRFEGGENIDRQEPLSLPFNRSWIWLGLLAAANIAVFAAAHGTGFF